MNTVWKILKRAGVVIGPLVFLTSVALAARDITELGISWYWWAAIGGGIFFVSGFAIIYGQHKDISRLQVQLSNDYINWIDTYIRENGKLPQVPEYLEVVVMNYSPGMLVSKEVQLRTPSVQFWNKLLPSQREKLLGLVKWLGQYPRDYEEKIHRGAPPGGIPRIRWI